MKESIAVIGAGSWGTTLAGILGANGHPVLLWVRNPQRCQQMQDTRENARYLPGHPLPDTVTPTHDLAATCQAARLILLVVPSHGLRQVARQMGEYLCGELVHATKGIEQRSFRRMSQVLREETCVRKIGVLTGPNLAREIASGHPAGTLVASNYQEVLDRWQAALHTPYFRVYQGHDVVGAEVAGAFKNIVAVVAGIVDGMGLGDNTRALLLTRGLYEMTQVGVAIGASAVTFGGLAGIGDLMATCAALVGEKLPDGAGEDSYDLTPLLQGKPHPAPLREATVHHSINGSFSIRQDRWKLEFCPGSGGWSYPRPKEAKKLGLPPIQLYDLTRDVSERKNVYTEHPEVVARLRALLARYVRDGRSTPGTPQPYVKPKRWPGLWWLEEMEKEKVKEKTGQ